MMQKVIAGLVVVVDMGGRGAATDRTEAALLPPHAVPEFDPDSVIGEQVASLLLFGVPTRPGGLA